MSFKLATSIIKFLLALYLTVMPFGWGTPIPSFGINTLPLIIQPKVLAPISVIGGNWSCSIGSSLLEQLKNINTTKSSIICRFFIICLMYIKLIIVFPNKCIY